MQVLESVQPLYKISCYGDELYRIVRSDRAPSLGFRSPSPEAVDREEVVKFDSALSRAKSLCREYALCNHYDYFVTLTFDSRWDRYSLQDRVKELMQWFQNYRRSHLQFRYLLVPEFHKDGAVHFHGLISGISPADQPPLTPRSIVDTGFKCWPEYSKRYGFSTISPIVSNIGCGFYITKYITKSLSEMSSYFGVHTYYHSRGLSRSLVVGSVFTRHSDLDSLCKYSNNFYSFGFFKASCVGDVIDKCDEVNDMYKSWVLTDIDGSPVCLVGGCDDEKEEEYIQEVLSFFSRNTPLTVSASDPGGQC